MYIGSIQQVLSQCLCLILFLRNILNILKFCMVFSF